MVNRGITAAAVALALLASVHTALCQTTETCDRQTGIICYWLQAHNYGVQVLIPVRGNETEYLKNVCTSEQQLPKKPKCEALYAGCNETEKAKFKMQEEGYTRLQRAVTDVGKCREVQKLAKCIKEDVMADCEVHFYKFPTHEGARKNHEAAVNLTMCLNESLAECGQEFSDSTKYIQSIADALTLLYWHHEHSTTPAPATSELPSSTSVSTEAPTHETTPTTEKTVPTSEQTTEHPHPTEHTTELPVTTTTPSHSTEPSTKSPTETPTPATTPKPSGAATSVPFFGTLVFIFAVRLAQAA